MKAAVLTSRNQIRLGYQFIRKCSIYTAHKIDLDEPKFDKILIANRGEIACRVMKTAKLMNIKTVAVHSTVDHNAPHVQLADEAVCIGTAEAKDSYLLMDRILEAVHETGSQAVHPGYGFLSENAEFVKKLEDSNVAFIGPSAAAMTGMGDKLTSKRIALEAGVSTIPGYDGIIKDAAECVKMCQEIGYPVMIKASAGGGGKGMRIAWNDQQAKDGFKLSSQEAASSFGDDRILVEKFVDNPRHIEIQVLGDKHGNAIYLNERECSIQRRNQKVIEEAPSSFLDEETRQAMGAQAVALTKNMDYSSAGTVEFLVDSKKNFFFLEMNTRLQVEHPITECITGVDLVHQMIRVAKGHPLTLTQKDIGIRGWAVESRVYAEDPYKNFGLPSIGRLSKYIEPLHIDKVRCDSGVREGSDISIYYDPMICKLVCYGDTRKEAIDRSVKALDAYVIRGVTHNIPLLRDILTEESFCKGDITTKYLETVYPKGFMGKIMNKYEEKEIASLLSVIFAKDTLRSRGFINKNEGSTSDMSPNSWNLIVTVASQDITCHVERTANQFKVTIDRETLTVNDDFNLSSTVIEATINNNEETIQIMKIGHSGDIKLSYKGTLFAAKISSQGSHYYMSMMPKKVKADVTKQVLSPMPGLVKSVSCAPGDMVSQGQEVCVIEAMKMQNSLAIGATGTVKSVNIKVGQTVEEEEVLIELQ